MARISACCRRHIRNSEGLRLKAYKDAAGVWTIGYGSTYDVKPGDIMTEVEARERFEDDLSWFEQGIENMLGRPATRDQFDALVSLAYNIGLPALKKSTLLRKFNSGDVTGAAAEFDKWVHAGGRKLPGLVTRRKIEREMFEGR